MTTQTQPEQPVTPQPSPEQQLQRAIQSAILRDWQVVTIGNRTASMRPVDAKQNRTLLITVDDAGEIKYHLTELPKPKHRRVLMWTVLTINALFLIWLIGYWVSVGDPCASETTYQDACRTGASLGIAAGTFLILAFWACVDIVLGVIYMVTRRK